MKPTVYSFIMPSFMLLATEIICMLAAQEKRTDRRTIIVVVT